MEYTLNRYAKVTYIFFCIKIIKCRPQFKDTSLKLSYRVTKKLCINKSYRRIGKQF